MPTINVNDAYVLNETGAEVDKVTGLFTKNENATTDEKQMARLNIAAGGSNRNLLDNWYFVGGGSQLGDGVFPINQRGQTSYSGGGVQLDRWRTWAGDDTIVLTANGVQYTSPTGNGLFQYFPSFPCGDDTCTFSTKIGGTIYSVTLPEGQNDATFWGSGFALIANRSNNTVGILSVNTTLLLQAAKLEKGSISTLANDAPPDFGEELRKCMRYFVRITAPAYGNGLGIGRAYSSYDCRVFIPLSVPLRASPTVALTGSGNVALAGNGGSYAITSASYSGRSENGVSLSFATSGITANQLYMLYRSANDAVYLDLSADL